MDNQHRHIKGYRDLSQTEIDAMNDIKQVAEQVRELVELLQQDQFLDQRWVSIGKTDLQKGFMALVRSVAQPETF
jgi:Ni,Fe-hydrogenase III large subunit